MSGIRFEFTRDPERFAARADAFLAAKIERNVLATVLLSVLSGPLVGGAPLFATGVDDRGEVRAVALRTPPWPLLAADIARVDADGLLSA